MASGVSSREGDSDRDFVAISVGAGNPACRTKNRKFGLVVRAGNWSGNSSRAAGTGCGSLTTEIRKPAPVKASVIACSGRCQKRMWAVWPPMVQATVQLYVAK
jgi:hypothetical protein